MSHTEEHFEGSEMVRDIVIGMSDGLTVPFALAAGLSSAVSDQGNGIIITAGIAEIIAGSIAMGLGGYLAGKTEIEHYDAELKREHFEIINYPEKERQEIHEIFEHYGLSEEARNQVIIELEKDHDKYADFMMKFELGLEKPELNRARKSALTIGISYIIGGMVPLTAYIFTNHPKDGFFWSSIITVLCLFTFGYTKAVFMKQNPWKAAIRVTLIGMLAAGTAYFVAGFFA
jgi:VIT1/CCC1 family predicted Fe2+/Mn2+ transporter